MRIGMQPSNSGRNATPALITEIAELADRLGYDSLQLTDHLVMPLEYSSVYPYNSSGRMAAGPDDDYYEPLSLLGYLAGRTSHIRLGTSVLVAPYRNPVVTAKQLACLDNLSGGRLVLGLGVGWMEEEFVAVGAPPFHERGKVTDEIIAVFRALWREQPVSFSGTYFQFAPLGVMPKPLQAGGIPIIVGGMNKAAIRRAVRLADGWQPFKLSPDELKRGMAELHAQADRFGRDLTNFTISLRLGLRLSRTPGERRPAEEPGKAIVGTPEQALADLKVYAALGVTEVVFDFRSCTPEETRETLELGAELLIPALATSATP